MNFCPFVGPEGERVLGMAIIDTDLAEEFKYFGRPRPNQDLGEFRVQQENTDILDYFLESKLQ